MARLPNPGGDDGTWGDILNAYLAVSLNNDGTIQTSAISSAGGELTTNKGAAGGYAGLNGSVHVPSAQLGSGTANTTTYLRGDGSWQVPPGSGGSSTLSGLSDVSIVSPTNNQLLTYNSGSSLWINQVPPVTSVAGKTGAVTLVEGDITNLTTDLAAKVAKSGDTMTGKLIVPSFQVTGGSPATGKVLTADGSGNASWSPSTPGIVVALGTVSGTVNCDLSAGVAFTATLTGDTTFQFTNWPSGLVEPEIYTAQDSSGGHAITVTGVTWEPTGAPPSFSTAPNAVNIIPVASFNSGSNIYGITGLAGPTGPTGPAGTTIVTFSMPGSLTIKVGAGRQYVEQSYTISAVRASVGTAPVGSSIICDVNKNGTTIYTTQGNRPTITTGTNTATANSPNITSLSAGDYLTVDVDQIGSSTAGADLTVTITIN